MERSTMVSRITDLANVAADKFDQQKAAAVSLASSMQDTITALKESSALTAMLLDKYVAQNAYLDAATGAIVQDLSCSRASVWRTSFSVNRCALGYSPVCRLNWAGKICHAGHCVSCRHDAAATGHVLLVTVLIKAGMVCRIYDAVHSDLHVSCASSSKCTDHGCMVFCLLALRSSASSAPSSRRRLAAMAAGNEGAWEGYRVAVASHYAASGVDDSQAPERARHAGVRQNRVVGGLFLHSTRKLTNPSCAGEGCGSWHADDECHAAVALQAGWWRSCQAVRSSACRMWVMREVNHVVCR